jgi:hypothetical protein
MGGRLDLRSLVLNEVRVLKIMLPSSEDFTLLSKVYSDSSPSRNFQQSTDNARRFKYYCYYAFGLIAATILGIIILNSLQRTLRDTVFIFVAAFFVLLVILAVADFILLVLTGIRMNQLSKSMSENTRFMAEKNRFGGCSLDSL